MDLERARRKKAEDENRLLKEAATITNASSNSKKLMINTTVTHTNENIISPTTENIKLKKKISKFATSEKQMLSTLEQRLVDLNDARAKVKSSSPSSLPSLLPSSFQLMRLKSAANTNTNTYDDDNVAFLEEKMSEYER